MTGEVLLDSSALLAVFFGQPGEDIAGSMLDRAAISAVNWAEVVEKFLTKGGSLPILQGTMDRLQLPILPLGGDDAAAAALLVPETYRAGLSLADRCCLALARRLGVPVLTADRAWASVDVGVKVQLIR